MIRLKPKHACGSEGGGGWAAGAQTVEPVTSTSALQWSERCVGAGTDVRVGEDPLQIHAVL